MMDILEKSNPAANHPVTRNGGQRSIHRSERLANLVWWQRPVGRKCRGWKGLGQRGTVPKSRGFGTVRHGA